MAENGDATTIDLAIVNFGETPRELIRWKGLSVTAFRYRSGVKALRVRNAAGEIIFLPYHGQQIWDAVFHGRCLTMGSLFDEPTGSEKYVENYGAFFLHCGASAMGIPGPEDTHPLHGELPNAQYQDAYLTFGTEPRGSYIDLSGRFVHVEAFGHHYEFQPRIRLMEASSVIEMTVEITNLRRQKMDFMYLAHTNFRPVDGAKIVDSVSDDTTNQRVVSRVPLGETDKQPDWLKVFTAEPGKHRSVEEGAEVDYLIGIDCEAGKDGWFNALQVLPDGTADVMSHRPEQLPHAIRWMTRNGDEDALGLVLPGTAEVGGYTAESKKGRLVALEPNATFVAVLRFGVLSKEEASQVSDKILAEQWWLV